MKKRKGVFIIFALWLFALLSLFCLGLGFRTFVEIRKTKLFLDRIRAYQLAVSGINLAEARLQADEDTAVDHEAEDWRKVIEREINYTRPVRQGKLLVSITDESSRVNIDNLNFAEQFKSLMELKGIDDCEEKIKYFLDYVDTDEEARSGDSETDVKNAALSVVEELMLLKDFSAQDYDKIKDVITVFGEDNKVNVNTATKDVLEVLIEDSEIENKILLKRFSGEETSGYYVTKDGVNEWNTFLNTLTEEKRTELNNIFKLNSDLFRVVSQAQIGSSIKKITCIISRSSGTISYWYEE